MKQAILVVSFGTTHLDTLEQNIVRLEQSVAQQFPEARIFRAFTSPTIRRRLAQLHGIRVPSVEEALEQLIREGWDAVTVQPSLLIPGEEFDRLREAVLTFADRICLKLGRPLLWEDRDLDTLVQILLEQDRPDPDTVLLLMGHGTEHPANDLYVRLDRRLRQEQSCTARLCTVEGTPTFADAAAELRQLPQRRVLVVPLMLVAGEHARNDMAGEGPGSLRSVLEQAGFSVECRIRGLGQLDPVRRCYADRIRAAEIL